MTTPMPPQRPALQHRPPDPGPNSGAESGDNALRTSAGRTTADSLRPERRVRLDVRVPKSMRKELRAEAKRRGMSVSDLVALLVRDRR